MGLFLLLLLLTCLVEFLMGQRITKEQRELLINPNLFYLLPKFLKNKVQGLFKTELPTFCTICITDCEPQEMYRIRLCGCWFCKTVSSIIKIENSITSFSFYQFFQCLKIWIESDITSKNPKIRCPSLNCLRKGSLLELKDIEKLVSNDNLEKHKSTLMDLEVSKSQNMVWCPKPDCNTACNFPHQSNNAVCPTCFNDFCIKCLKDWHFGSPCQLEDLTDLNVKNCPTCSIPIHRTEGCDAMFCSRCRTSFCWECLTPINGYFRRCSCKATTMLYNDVLAFAPTAHAAAPVAFVHALCAIFLYSLMLTFLGYLQIEFNKNTDKNLRFMSFGGTFALFYWVFYVQPFFRFDAPDFRILLLVLWVYSLVVGLYQL